MRKAQKIMLGVFLAGVVISGVGTGIALVEYSSMTYEGVRILGEDKMVTRNFDYKIDGKEDEILLVKLDRYLTRYMSPETGIVEDREVPVGTLRYQITYNEDLVSPELRFLPYEQESIEAAEDRSEGEEETLAEGGAESEEEVPAESGAEDEEEVPARGGTEGEEETLPGDDTSRCLGELYLDIWYSGDSLDVIMENKDRILTDIKQRKFARYDVASVGQVVIRANPETISRVREVTDW